MEKDTPVDVARRYNQQALYDHFLLVRQEEKEFLNQQNGTHSSRGPKVFPGKGRPRKYEYQSNHPGATSPFMSRNSPGSGSKLSSLGYNAISSRAQAPSSSALALTSSSSGSARNPYQRVRQGYRKLARSPEPEEDPSTFHKSGFESSDSDSDSDDVPWGDPRFRLRQR